MLRLKLRLLLPAALAAVCLLLSTALGDGAVRYVPGEVRAIYDSGTLRYNITEAKLNGARCWLTRVWMADPGRQIIKETAQWGKHLAWASDLAQRRGDCRLAVSGSGYVSPVYAWIPEDYPGTCKDYYYTPLGSLTVTHGEVLRRLEGVPFTGLTLEADGLHCWREAEVDEVLARSPAETWAFYAQCPLILDGADALDRDWDFAQRKAVRQIIARLDANTLLILTTRDALSLIECTEFLLEQFRPEMAFNLDGGPSAALLRRNAAGAWKTVQKSTQKNVDIMGFID